MEKAIQRAFHFRRRAGFDALYDNLYVIPEGYRKRSRRSTENWTLSAGLRRLISADIYRFAADAGRRAKLH
jgi:hypothetical protein